MLGLRFPTRQLYHFHHFEFDSVFLVQLAETPWLDKDFRVGSVKEYASLCQSLASPGCKSVSAQEKLPVPIIETVLGHVLFGPKS